MEEIVSHLKTLCKDIGQRGSTTEGEKRSAEYIYSIFKKSCEKYFIESFSSIKSFTWTYFIIYLLNIIGASIFIFSESWIGLIFSFLSLILFILDIHTIGIISAILPKGKSQNIIGKIPAKKECKKKLVIIAHYDSSKSGFVFHPKRVKNFRIAFLSTFASMTLTTVFYIFGILLPKFWIFFSMLSLLPLLILLFTIFILIHREYFGINTCGANDNASGVSVMLALSEYFSKINLDFLEIWFLATGAEEVGLVGMLEFIKKHGKDLKDAYFVNLDNIGSGQLKYLIGEGMLKTFYVKDDFLKILERVNSKKDFRLKPYIFKTMLTDATSLLIRGYNAVTLMAFSQNNLLPNWHWVTDIFENVDLSNLNLAFNFVKELIFEI